MHIPGPASSAVDPTWQSVAPFIDHTLLRPEATSQQIAQVCQEAAHFGFAAVCVNPVHIAQAWSLLRNTPVKVATVIGFPLGAALATVKRAEASECLTLGADELDMVINVGALKARDKGLVLNDIRGVVDLAHPAGALVKVILETVLLNNQEKILGCELALEAGADFVKTSTGFASGGATVEDVALMRGVVGDRAGVKASAGIRSAAHVAAMLAAGADRIGTSASVAIMAELGAPGFEASRLPQPHDSGYW